MKCIKRVARDFFNLFTVYDCAKCEEFVAYTYIYIGNQTINIYRLLPDCFNKSKQDAFYKLFFKEMLLNKDNWYLILSAAEFERNFPYFPLFLAENDLYILIDA